MDLFGSSGLRGIALSELQPDDVVRIAKAAGSEWGARAGVDRVAVARDTRTTGTLFCNAAATGLAAVGCDVDRLAVVPTPAVCRYCEHETVPAVLVTASHNPPEFNGIKLVASDGVELGADVLERIEERVLEARFATADWESAGIDRRVEGVTDDYLDELVGAVDREAIANADLTVAVDPGHGAGSVASPELFRRLGCEVVTVNANPDGHFPGRNSEPVPGALGDLRRLVRARGADVGIAHDGDADRAVFVDEKGASIAGEASFAALAADTLSVGDTVVAAVNVSQRLVDVCDRAGADLQLTPIGATRIITRIQNLQAEGVPVPIAGEGNGGVFFPPYRLTRDGPYIGARFLELLVDGTPASELVAPYTEYHNVRINLEYDSESDRTAMLEAAADYAAAADVDVDDRDGYRLDYGDAWVLVRPSGTEPKIRIYSEAGDPDRARELAEAIEEVLENAR